MNMAATFVDLLGHHFRRQAGDHEHTVAAKRHHQIDGEFTHRHSNNAAMLSAWSNRDG